VARNNEDGIYKTNDCKSFVGEPDYLVVDCTPGIDDEPLSVIQTLMMSQGV